MEDKDLWSGSIFCGSLAALVGVNNLEVPFS